MTHIQQVSGALLAVGLQGVVANGLSHLLGPEHAAHAQHHLLQPQQLEQAVGLGKGDQCCMRCLTIEPFWKVCCRHADQATKDAELQTDLMLR